MADFKAPRGAKVKDKDRVDRDGVSARFIGRPKSDWGGADMAGKVVEADDRNQNLVFEAEGGTQYRADYRDGYVTDVVGGFLPGGVPTSEHWAGATGEADGDPGHEDPLYVRLEGTVPGEPGDNAGRLPETRPDMQHQRSEDRPRPAKFHESGYVSDQPRDEVADIKDQADEEPGAAERRVADKHAEQEDVKEEPATLAVDRAPEDRGYQGLPVGEGGETNMPVDQPKEETREEKKSFAGNKDANGAKKPKAKK